MIRNGSKERKKDKHENQIQFRGCKVKGIIVFVSQIFNGKYINTYMCSQKKCFHIKPHKFHRFLTLMLLIHRIFHRNIIMMMVVRLQKHFHIKSVAFNSVTYTCVWRFRDFWLSYHIHKATDLKCLRHTRGKGLAKYSISKPIIPDTFIFDIFTRSAMIAFIFRLTCHFFPFSSL